jgi:hypothetical protein
VVARPEREVLIVQEKGDPILLIHAGKRTPRAQGCDLVHRFRTVNTSRRGGGEKHDPAEFIVGNLFTDSDIADRLDTYRFHDRYQVGANPTCGSCAMAGDCGKGPPGRGCCRWCRHCRSR